MYPQLERPNENFTVQREFANDQEFYNVLLEHFPHASISSSRWTNYEIPQMVSHPSVIQSDQIETKHEDNDMKLTRKMYQRMHGVNIFVEKIKNKTTHFVEISLPPLIEVLKNITDWEELYRYSPINMTKVLCSLQSIKYSNQTLQNNYVSRFVSSIESFNKEYLESIANMLSCGKISHDVLWYLFSGNKQIVHTINGELSAGDVKKVEYSKHTNEFIITYYTYTKVVNYKYNVTNVNKLHTFVKIPFVCTITQFSGVKSINDLSIKLLDRNTKQQLQLRGSKCVKLLENNQPVHVYYNGDMICYDKKIIQTYKKIKVNGRIIIDIEFNDFNSNHRTESGDMESINYWMIYPFLYGYNLSHGKTWGEVSINGISPINYNNNAYDELYLPLLNGTNRKDLILNFIKNKNNFVKDLIKGKGEGIVFLLHGPSGVGKTLTAEATAEVLHSPLYYVNATDLGTTVNDIEENMTTIMNLANRWNALVLCDEADVFVEKRTTSDINRNAIVGTFLKMLEYYNGIIFLTTNRVTEFDSAIIDRVHVKFEYDELDDECRLQIWQTLLNKIKNENKINSELLSPFSYKKQSIHILGEIDEKQISKLKLNGRQIRTCLNLALCQAEQQKCPLNTSHILNIYNMKFF